MVGGKWILYKIMMVNSMLRTKHGAWDDKSFSCPMSAKQAGFSFEQLVVEILRLAIEGC